MEDAASRRHPLNAPIFKNTFVPFAICMRHFTGDHVGYSFKTAMGMAGKARYIFIGVIASKGVH